MVGDSMRGSLRGLTIERLGKTEVAVVPGRFFASKGITKPGVSAVPLILFDSARMVDRYGATDVAALQTKATKGNISANRSTRAFTWCSDRMEMLTSVVRMMGADGELHETEKELFALIAAKMELSNNEVNEVIDRAMADPDSEQS